ncbi:hypothetical protein V8B55DRAFT_1552657 [Mucor lusitanicus]|uniref:Uncharacterized protein n=2 Tax=Mucor circinelloides f. lusitanicus TaxID=29924 RepID=A0A168P5U4_MUCCL|nr:hypothetical protein MUCCIDRAFT_160801 [Mucor lusitanicus CBS 277.49]
MIVNIEKAEEIVSYGGGTKKHLITQKKLLLQVIDRVQHRRKMIHDYLTTVDIISQQYNRRKNSLEQLIHHLDDRGHALDQGLQKISHQQKELQRKQIHLEQDLQLARAAAEKSREKKIRCEQHYHAVVSVPLLSAQSKKRYLKARDVNAEAEQQVSEKREALEKCRAHLKLMSKTVSAQYCEQDQLCNQRRGSVDTIMTSTQQLAYLKQGCEFWSGFDSYQAQVVLESAIYLSDSENQLEKKKTNSSSLDIHQIWTKTFKLACFEYGDREAYGDTRWNPQALEVNFDCDMCQTSQTGWPKVIREYELACDLCYSTIDEAVHRTIQIVQDVNSASKATIQQHCYPSSSKMKKLVSSFFHQHSSKVNPSM